MEASTSTTRIPTRQERGRVLAALVVLAACTAAALALAAYALAVAAGTDRAEPAATRASMPAASPPVLLEPSTSLPGAGVDRLNRYGRALSAGASRRC
jgi:hypothetical protein